MKNVCASKYLPSVPGSICYIGDNDQLKLWGFCIHGCVDGFSRKLL